MLDPRSDDLIQQQQENKDDAPVTVEKEDVQAMLIAAFQVFAPAILGVVAVFALVIWLITTFWFS